MTTTRFEPFSNKELATLWYAVSHHGGVLYDAPAGSVEAALRLELEAEAVRRDIGLGSVVGR